MNQEDAFAQEAQEEALIRRRSPDPVPEDDAKSPVRTTVAEDTDTNDESSPLIADRPTRTSRAGLVRAGDSYMRAINEPWHGSHGSGPLPWWKRPSVSHNCAAEVPTPD
jgi:hypothetical protein